MSKVCVTEVETRAKRAVSAELGAAAGATRAVKLRSLRARLRTTAAATLILLALILQPACLAKNAETNSYVARYGPGGRELALTMARQYPFRSPGSSEEAACAEFLQQELQKSGLTVEKQAFTWQDAAGNHQSSNLIVRLPGRGFTPIERKAGDNLLQSAELQPPAILEQRNLILLAHYDVSQSRANLATESQITAETGSDGLPIQRPQLPSMEQSDGIHDNAAAVASLVVAARLLQEQALGYNITIVFLGAAHADFAGANFLAANLPAQELSLCDGIINLDSIYAGDKVYAHAGKNSVRPGNAKDYSLRRKLYECTDVYYDNLLLTNNDFALYTNQAGCPKDLPGVGTCIYREWSERQSDHSVFESSNVPIVFFDSGDYAVEDCSESFKESSDPYFASVGGLIKGSYFDSSKILTAYFAPQEQAAEQPFGGTAESQGQASADPVSSSLSREKQNEEYLRQSDRLEKRINNLAFILVECCKKTPPGTKIK